MSPAYGPDRATLTATIQKALPGLDSSFCTALNSTQLQQLADALGSLATAQAPIPPTDMDLARSFASRNSETLRKAGRTEKQFCETFAEVHRKKGRAAALGILRK